MEQGKTCLYSTISSPDKESFSRLSENNSQSPSDLCIFLEQELQENIIEEKSMILQKTDHSDSSLITIHLEKLQGSVDYYRDRCEDLIRSSILFEKILQCEVQTLKDQISQLVKERDYYKSQHLI